MNRLILIIVLGLLLYSSAPVAQELEEIWESAGDDPSIQAHFESLKENPIDLNTATAARLQDVLFLDPLLANAIIRYRNQHYPLKSTDEILNVPGLPESIYHALQSFITVEAIPQPIQHRYKVESRWYRRYPHSIGYSQNVYQGDPIGVCSEITCTQGNISLGGLVHKDPGEFRWNDHQAVFLRIDNIFNQENRLILGAYRLGFGQGLVISNGFRLSSSTADPMAILPRHPIGLREFHSTSEYNYFQGAAFQNRYRHVSVTLFLSRVFRDASVNEGGYIATIQTTGLHRTASEQANRQTLREDLWGAHLDYTSQVVAAGITAYHVDFNPPLASGDPVTQHFRLEGDQNHVLGVNVASQLGNVHLAGEIAWSKSGGQALLVEGRYNIASAQTSCIYRRYDPDFHNMHAVALTEWGEDAQNEEGWLLAAKLPVWRGAVLAARADIVHTPWRTYSFPSTRQGTDIVISLEQNLARRNTVTVRYRGSRVEDLENDTIVREIRSGIRTQWDWRESKTRAFRVRWEQIKFHTPASLESGTGWMGYGQLTINHSRKLTGKYRLATFDVPVYGARIYAYEDDLPGRLVNRLFYGRGRRISARMKCMVTTGWNIWLKIATTLYDGVDTIGSGWDQIPARRNIDVGIALQCKH